MGWSESFVYCTAIICLTYIVRCWLRCTKEPTVHNHFHGSSWRTIYTLKEWDELDHLENVIETSRKVTTERPPR